MSVELVGEPKKIVRRRTGLFSFDLAMADKKKGNLGMPLRTIIEAAGRPESGKSTLFYYLAGQVTGKGMVIVCDLESSDEEYVRGILENNGFNGKLWMIETQIPKKEIFKLERFEGHKASKVGAERWHEEMMKDMTIHLNDEEVGAVLLDSVGAIQPMAEKEGDFGEAFMGKRAKLVGQTVRAAVSSLRNKETPSVMFVTNHYHMVMGGGHGHSTAGGETLKHLEAARMILYSNETFKDGDDGPILGYQVQGTLEKHRYGGKGGKFQFYMVPGFGVHVGATALFDCLDLGLVEASTVLKLDGKSIGYKRDYLRYAADGKSKKFEPFQEALAEYEKTMFKKLEAGHGNDDKLSDKGEDDLLDSTDDSEGTDEGTATHKTGRKRRGTRK